MMLWLALACSAPTPRPQPTVPVLDSEQAHVTSVVATGNEGAWRFTVTVQSPDTGCDRYADWWEVLNTDGALLYRRILDHSHVDEQPFARSGGPIEVPRTETLWVRAHLHPTGYAGQVLSGTVDTGFTAAAELPNVSEGVEQAAPQPDGCDF